MLAVKRLTSITHVFVIVLAITMVFCGRKESKKEAKEEFETPPVPVIPKPEVPFFTLNGNKIVLESGVKFRMTVPNSDNSGKVELLGKYRTKKNGFTRFEVNGPEPYPESSSIANGYIFYGRLTQDETLISVGPTLNAINIWIAGPDCSSRGVFQVSSTNTISDYQNRTGSLNVDTQAFLGRIDNGFFLRQRSLALFDTSDSILEQSDNFQCKISEFPNTFSENSYAIIKAIGYSVGLDGSKQVMIAPADSFDLPKTKDEFWGALSTGGKAIPIKLKLENLAATNQIKIEVKDIDPSDNNEGNKISFTKTLGLRKTVEKGYFHSLAGPTTPSTSGQEDPATDTALLEEATIESNTIENPKGTPVQCLIHNNEKTTRAQWIVCNGLLEGKSEFDLFDNPYFNMVAASKMRKKNKEEKKKDQEEEQARNDEAKKQHQELINKLKEERQNTK